MAALVPTLAGHRLQGDDGVDGSSLRCLLGIILEEKEEEERRKEEEKEKEQASRTSAPKRTRQKRRKKKTPKASSSRGRARRRQRQRHVSGFPGDVLLRAVFLSVVDRPEVPCIMAVMVQKDSCSGMCKAGIAGDNAPRAVSSLRQAHDARLRGRCGPEGQLRHGAHVPDW